MVNEKMKEIFEQGGLSQTQIETIQEKYDFDKIYEIINSAANPNVALEKINAFYPELEVAKMQEQMDFIQSQIEAASHGEKTEIPVELTEDELESVVGGSWWGDNWKRVVITAVTVVVATACGALVGAFIGSPGGPVGMAVGAIVGGLAAGGFLGWMAWETSDPNYTPPQDKGRDYGSDS